MEYIKLDCKRGSKERGAILSVGAKADITREEADVLISERMAYEYTQPVVSQVDMAEITRLGGELETANSEITRLGGELETANSEITRLTEENAKLQLTAPAAPKAK